MVSILSASEISLSLGGNVILDDISFSLERGKFLAVVGPNGAGKSSLLKCLGRLRKDFSGEVMLEGASVSAMSQKMIARRVAWVHQTGTDLLPYTVREFAEMSRYPWQRVFSGMSARDDELVAGAIRMAGVEEFTDRELRSLSGGERQRALIAAALAQGTDLLFLDEPTSFLDYRHQVETLLLIERINREHGITVVLVTHDVNLALHGADEILALKKGRLVWCGARDEFLDNGLLSFVFDTDFVRFAAADGVPYVAPRGFVE